MTTNPDADETVLLDPTLALKDIRSLTRRIRRDEEYSGNVGMMIDSFDDLDAWMTEGGYLPDQWRKPLSSPGRRGRPRRVGDGEKVLTGVVHGKRSTYVKGCHCVKCTQANREAAAVYRQQQRKQNGE